MAAKKKGKILESKFENQIPNPRGKLFKPLSLLLSLEQDTYVYLFHEVWPKILEPIWRGKAGCDGSQRKVRKSWNPSLRTNIQTLEVNPKTLSFLSEL